MWKPKLRSRYCSLLLRTLGAAFDDIYPSSFEPKRSRNADLRRDAMVAVGERELRRVER